jgi:hypothetical protein
MLNFCTLFDINYLTRGLALYYSLEKNTPSFHLYIFAFDNLSYNILTKLGLKSATIISLEQFEDDELLALKPSRSKMEYCWTCTPSVILFVLDRYKVESCTYLDADLFFYSDPQVLLHELGEKSVLITEHRFSKEYKKDMSRNGIYCVQFITFKNDVYGREVLSWWRAQCNKWCYARYEDGKFGDQTYLNDWTIRFPKVHVLEHLGGGIAGWNVSQYNFSAKEDKIKGEVTGKGIEFEVVFYHFHYLKLFNNGKMELGARRISDEVKRIFYKPYIKKLLEFSKSVGDDNPGINVGGISAQIYSWKTPLSFLKRKMKGMYNIYSLATFLDKY